VMFVLPKTGGEMSGGGNSPAENGRVKGLVGETSGGYVLDSSIVSQKMLTRIFTM
jgi:hypothetical protein